MSRRYVGAGLRRRAVLACRHRLADGVAQGRPAQQRALHPGGELRHPREGDRVAQRLLVRLGTVAGRQHLAHLVIACHRLAHFPSRHQVGHHRRPRGADRAAHRLVRDVRDDRCVVGTLDARPQPDLVPARGVDVVHLDVERRPQPGAVRRAGVVEDQLLVQRVHAHAKNLRTWSRPSTSASTSPVVV